MRRCVTALISWIALCALPVLSHASAQPEPVRIALVSDTHLHSGTNRVLHASRFDQVIDSVNASQVQLVLVAGDLTEDGNPQEYEAFRRQVRGFHAPAWYVAGNHDVGNKRLAPSPGAVHSTRVNRYQMRLGPGWYDRQHAGVRVVGVNAPLFGSKLAAERRQWEFLEAVLKRPSPTPTILLTHFPLFVNKVDEPGGEYWNYEPVERMRLLSLLKLGGVDAVLSGHLHRPITNKHDNIFFYSTPAVAFSLSKKQGPGWTLVHMPRQGAPTLEWKPVAAR